jgi:CelD/BcsL family acetyltransferase involved in cellulose biosynthesis
VPARLLPLNSAATPLDRWRSLAAEAIEPNPFAEPELVLPAVRHLEGGEGVRLLTVEDDDGMLFALPVARGRSYQRVPVPAVTTWQHDYCFLGTPLVSPRADAGTVRAALAVLRSGRTAPRLVLSGLPTTGPVAELLREALVGRAALVRQPGPSRAVLHRRLAPTYLEETLSSSRRRELRRRRKRLAEDLDAEVSVVDRAEGGDEVAAAVEDFLRLEASGWKGPGGTGTAMACRPGHADFFRELCDGFRRAGRLQMLTLGSDGVPVAMICAFLSGQAHFKFKVAFDDAFATRGPGLQLEIALVEQFHADPRLNWLDSCSDGEDSTSAELYPDRRQSESLLLPLHGLSGLVATRGHPAAQGVKRRLAPVRRASVARVAPLRKPPA